MKNKNKVPLKQWRKWSATARCVFNRVYEFMHDNQWALLAHGQPQIKPSQWKVTAWNSAWIAADAVDNTLPAKVILKRQ